MWFGKKNAPLPAGVIATSEALELEIVTSYKYFSQHISKLQAKLNLDLVSSIVNRSSFTPAAKLTLIQMTILPMLDYGYIIYRSAGNGALELARCPLPFGHQICHQCSS